MLRLRRLVGVPVLLAGGYLLAWAGTPIVDATLDYGLASHAYLHAKVGPTWWVLMPMGICALVLGVAQMYGCLASSAGIDVRTQLRLISESAPLVGMLGTIVGLIEATASIGGQSDPAAIMKTLAPPVANALWSTVVGLVIGMWAWLSMELSRLRVPVSVVVACAAMGGGTASAQVHLPTAAVAIFADFIGARPGRPPVRQPARRALGEPREDVAALIHQTALQEGVHPLLAEAIARSESGLAWRIGQAGEVGYFQLQAAAAKEVHVDRHDPRQNIVGGIRYLKKQLLAFSDRPNTVSMAVAAYNAGPGVVAAGAVPRRTTRYVNHVLRTYYRLKEGRNREDVLRHLRGDPDVAAGGSLRPEAAAGDASGDGTR